MGFLKVKDLKKYEKDLIKVISEQIAYKSAYLHHDSFSYEFRDYEAYKLQDKALSKRIKKYLMKRYGINATCWDECDYYLSCRQEEPILLTIRITLDYNKHYEYIRRY